MGTSLLRIQKSGFSWIPRASCRTFGWKWAWVATWTRALKGQKIKNGKSNQYPPNFKLVTKLVRNIFRKRIWYSRQNVEDERVDIAASECRVDGPFQTLDFVGSPQHIPEQFLRVHIADPYLGKLLGRPVESN